VEGRKPLNSQETISTVPARDLAIQHIKEDLAVKQAILNSPDLLDTVVQVGSEFARVLQQGSKIFFFGNGGSAADAQHLAAELMGRFERERHPLPAIALTVNTSNLTAIGNDYGFDEVFSRQLEGLGMRGDVAVGISTSGKSPNVLKALRSARKMGIVTVEMIGQSCVEMARAAEYCISVPSTRTARVQEAHILIGHILCEIVEKSLAPKVGEAPNAGYLPST
jgi:D-sedoheptulose 7-phosphate isomerase